MQASAVRSISPYVEGDVSQAGLEPFGNLPGCFWPVPAVADHHAFAPALQRLHVFQEVLHFLQDSLVAGLVELHELFVNRGCQAKELALRCLHGYTLHKGEGAPAV